MTKRMIYSEVWEDDFVGNLAFFERLLWIGLITLADDQGRMLNNPTVIRSKVFVYDANVTRQAIESAIKKFDQAGKVVAYEADGKALLQIVNWWGYQSPSWPAASRWPAPPRWTDRINEHVPGGTRKLNWDKKGGFADENTGQVSVKYDAIHEPSMPIDELK